MTQNNASNQSSHERDSMVSLGTLKKDLAEATSIEDRLALSIQISIAEILDKELVQKYKATPINFEEVIIGTARGIATGLHGVASVYNPNDLQEQAEFMGETLNAARDFSMRILRNLYAITIGMTRQ